MTDAPLPPDHAAEEYEASHEGPIKTPKQLILAVLWAHIVPIAGILLLVAYVTTQDRPAAGSDALDAASTVRRIRPVGHVEVRDVADASSQKTGEQVFAAQCTACHTAGVAGAPKFGDAAAWAPRIATGYDALLHSALAGKGAMGPQGGGDFSDLEVGRAVVYMTNKAGARFDEPKAAAGPASAATAAKVDGGADADAGGAAAAAAQAAMATLAAAKPAAATTTVGATGAGNAAPTLFTQVCAACHAAGIAGAPKVGDKAAWAPRLAQGLEVLTASAIKGKGAMPPKGGSTASDAEIKAVVAYMANASR